MNRRLLIPAAALACAGVLSGCVTLADRVGLAANRYCAQTTETDRAAVRERVNQSAYPHRVRVECDAQGQP